MKKILVGLVIALALVGCGDKVEITPKDEKIKIVNDYFDRNDETKYNEITSKLQDLADKGNEKAEKELKRWEEIYREKKAKKMSEVPEDIKRRAAEFRKRALERASNNK